MSLLRMMVAHFHTPPPSAPAIVQSVAAYDYYYIAPVEAYMIFWSANGVCQFGGVDSGYSTYNWLLSGNAADYDIRFTRTGGSTTLSGVANNTWLRLNTDKSAYVSNPGGGGGGFAVTCVATVEIKYNANSTIISSNSCTWTAEIDITT